MTSSTSEAAIRRSREAAATALASDKAFILQTMSRPEGRAWVWRQLEFAQVFTPTSIADHATMAWREGRRNTGLKLLSELLQWTPSFYITMLVENSPANIQPPQDAEADD